MFVRHSMAKVFARCLMSFAACYSIAVGTSDESRLARYTTTVAEPTTEQLHVLDTTVSVAFSEKHKTVGDAVRYVLKPNGYRLAAIESIPDMAVLLALPLPAVHRKMGPMKLRVLLETLAGPSWQLVEDPVARVIGFELCEKTTEDGEQK